MYLKLFIIFTYSTYLKLFIISKKFKILFIWKNNFKIQEVFNAFYKYSTRILSILTYFICKMCILSIFWKKLEHL